MKKRGVLLAFAWLLGAVILLAGCAVGDQDEPGGNDKEPALKVGANVDVGDLTFTLNGARYEVGDESWAPEDGEAWIVFDCTVENRGSESAFVTAIAPASTFKLYDVEGYSKDTTVIATAKGNLNAEIAPSQKVSGEVAFVVKENEDEWEFIFSPHDDAGQAIYVLKDEDIR